MFINSAFHRLLVSQPLILLESQTGLTFVKVFLLLLFKQKVGFLELGEVRPTWGE